MAQITFDQPFIKLCVHYITLFNRNQSSDGQFLMTRRSLSANYENFKLF